MAALQNAMRALSSALQAGVLRSEIILHALTKGELREEDVAAALEPHIPGRMATANGVVVNVQGEQSALSRTCSSSIQTCRLRSRPRAGSVCIQSRACSPL